MSVPQTLVVELIPFEKRDEQPAELPAGFPRLLRAYYTQGQSLAQAVYLSGHFLPPALCSGIGHCGKCKVRLLSSQTFKVADPTPEDVRAFSPHELARGWRLACHHAPVAGLRVELPGDVLTLKDVLAWQREKALEANNLDNGALDEEAGALLAIDLGTTSVHWLQQVITQKMEMEDGVTIDPHFLSIWQGSTVNPQLGAGSDIVSRLALAQSKTGRMQLRALAVNCINRIVKNAQEMAPSKKVEAICLAANPTLTYLTLGFDTASLATAPYSLSYAGGDWVKIGDLPQVWIPPQLAPFVGGDISAGYAAIALDPDVPTPEYPFLLADLGTNGEFLLALSPDEALVASVALGPALEGIGLTHGTEARPYAITDYLLTPAGLKAQFLTEDGTPQTLELSHLMNLMKKGVPVKEAQARLSPQKNISSIPLPGITGTGYLSLVRTLLKTGALTHEGHFSPDTPGPLQHFFAPLVGTEPAFLLPHAMRFTGTDVEEILKVKASFCLGLRCLLERGGVAPHELARVYIAGSLGKHASKAALEDLGFFPQGTSAKMEASGNAALAGAATLLRHPQARTALVAWAEKVKAVDLSSDPSFINKFAGHMRFKW